MKALYVVLPALVVGCSKSSPSGPSPAASSSASVPVPQVASAAASASAAPAGAAVGASVWNGSYVSKIGAVEPPKNANEKTWTQDPGSTAVGKGAIELSIAERGDAHGETHGPLGEMTVSGTYDGHELRANLSPKEPKSDGAMTGYMTLAAEGNALKGTLRVSNRDAKIVREATVDLAKQ